MLSICCESYKYFVCDFLDVEAMYILIIRVIFGSLLKCGRELGGGAPNHT